MYYIVKSNYTELFFKNSRFQFEWCAREDIFVLAKHSHLIFDTIEKGDIENIATLCQCNDIFILTDRRNMAPAKLDLDKKITYISVFQKKSIIESQIFDKHFQLTSYVIQRKESQVIGKESVFESINAIVFDKSSLIIDLYPLSSFIDENRKGDLLTLLDHPNKYKDYIFFNSNYNLNILQINIMLKEYLEQNPLDILMLFEEILKEYHIYYIIDQIKSPIDNAILNASSTIYLSSSWIHHPYIEGNFKNAKIKKINSLELS